MGTKTYSGVYTIETFTANETWTVPAGVVRVDYLVVAGGGYPAGGLTDAYNNGGGGGGQVRQGSDLAVSGTVSVVVGAVNANSSFGAITSTKGGSGYTPGHGGNSGSGYSGGVYYGDLYSGGGGGAGSSGAGSNATAGSYGGTGGAGTLAVINNTRYGAGGGGGGSHPGSNGTGWGTAGSGSNGNISNAVAGIVIIRYREPSSTLFMAG